MDRNFMGLLKVQWARGNFVCVGLDSELEKIPKTLRQEVRKTDIRDSTLLLAFNRAIVEATKDLVCAFKPNVAFYEACGRAGWLALKETVKMIHEVAPEVPVILDAKLADIGNTNNGYVRMAFSYLNVDAITVNPYLGAEALQPFLARAEKGVIVLCRTSNPGASEFQDLVAKMNMTSDAPVPVYLHVAYRVAQHWNKNNNCALVVGATCPEELRNVRQIAPDLPILIPGIGVQGGDLEATVMAGKDSRGQGMIINSSRGIIFASKDANFADAARRETYRLYEAINQCLKKGVRV